MRVDTFDDFDFNTKFTDKFIELSKEFCECRFIYEHSKVRAEKKKAKQRMEEIQEEISKN